MFANNDSGGSSDSSTETIFIRRSVEDKSVNTEEVGITDEPEILRGKLRVLTAKYNALKKQSFQCNQIVKMLSKLILSKTPIQGTHKPDDAPKSTNKPPREEEAVRGGDDFYSVLLNLYNEICETRNSDDEDISAVPTRTKAHHNLIEAYDKMEKQGDVEKREKFIKLCKKPSEMTVCHKTLMPQIKSVVYEDLYGLPKDQANPLRRCHSAPVFVTIMPE